MLPVFSNSFSKFYMLSSAIRHPAPVPITPAASVAALLKNATAALPCPSSTLGQPLCQSSLPTPTPHAPSSMLC